ncbi:unnamed protein product, partial [Iphiclides podalirius]
MQMRLVVVALMLAGGHGGGVTNTDEEDISKYWADDLKVSGHLYARTSDRDLYGATLPPSVTFDVAATKLKGGALDITERFKPSDLSQASSTFPYNYGQVYKKQAEKDEQRTDDHYSNSDFRPYGQGGGQVYLKPLQRDKQKDEIPSGGFKPYFAVGPNPEASDGNEGTNDVFSTPQFEEAHGTTSGEVAEDSRVYATKARSKVRLLRGNSLQSRMKCRAGICRKKFTNRVYPRPAKRIKKIVYNY